MANLLVIDIGNTSISYGIIKSGRLRHYFYDIDDNFPKMRNFIVKSGIIRIIDKVIISSVNPKKLAKLLPILSKRGWSKNLLIIGRQLTPKIKHKYSHINKLGKDRLVNIYGALRWYSKPTLIINFGTAMTVDVISKKGIYEGGLIIPGIETSWKALQARAALLPKGIPIKDYKGFLGRDTEACMQAGILQGFGAMVDGLIGRFQARYGKSLFVLASGGLAKKVRPYIKSQVKVDGTHPIKSLALIYQDHLKNK